MARDEVQLGDITSLISGLSNSRTKQIHSGERFFFVVSEFSAGDGAAISAGTEK